MGISLLRSLVPYLADSYSTLLTMTTRIRTVRGGLRAALRAGDGRFIYAFWHQRQAFFTVTHRNDKVSILISRSKDGEIATGTMMRAAA